MILKILIVENKEMASLIKEGLSIVCEREGCEACFSIIDNGEAAVKAHMKDMYDLIIIDLMIPDGIEAIRAIREYDNVVSFVIITEKPSLETAIDAIHLKVFAYLIEPFTLSELATQSQNAVAYSLVKKKLLNLTKSIEGVLRRG